MKAILILGTFILCHAVSDAQVRPAPRHTEQIAFDQDRQVLVMHGGSMMRLRGEPVHFPKDINEWKNGIWNRVAYSTNLPNYRYNLLYNEKEKAVMLIGGTSRTPTGTDERFDVWKWNKGAWERMAQGSPLKEHEAVYDPINKRVLVYGNANINNGQRRCELWEFKSNAWKRLSENAPVFSNAEFNPYEIAFDANRKSLIVLSWEKEKSVVWEWKDEKWQKNECSGDCPSDRYYYSLAYHKKDKATYLFGGRNNTTAFIDELWKWDGKWMKVESSTKPAMRCATSMEYANESLILYGGIAEWGATNEMWEWKNGNWKLLNPEYALDAARKMDSLKFLMSQYPQEASLFHEYGSMMNRASKKQEAEAAYKKAVELDRSHPMYLFRLVELLYRQDKAEEVKAYLNEAITPGKPRDFYYRVGRVLLRSGYSEGIRFYEKANEMEPRGEDHYNVGRAYASLNDPTKAFENLNKAADLGYNSKQEYEGDAGLTSLKSDARWKGLLEKLK